MAKVVVANTLQQSVDTAIQLCGARGYSKDTRLEWIYRYARQARLVDGATEVHKIVLSLQSMIEGFDFWIWGRWAGRHVGNVWVSPCRSRWSLSHQTKESIRT